MRISAASCLPIALSICLRAAGAGPPIQGVATSTTAFLGPSVEGPFDAPTEVTSFTEFERTFGAPDDTLANPWLAPSVAAFFRNGGRRAWIVRVPDSGDEAGYLRALATLEAVDEPSLVCAPGATSLAIQSAIVSHCEDAGDRFALLDSVRGADSQQALEQRRSLTSNLGFAALYYPWLRVENGDAPLALIPPCGFVAGALTRSDLATGVWTVPTQSLTGAIGVERGLSAAEEDDLNAAGISVLRSFPGAGIRVWGARTIASDPEWKYVPIRRFFIFLEESIQEGIEWAVFEPNDEPLWAALRSSVEDFLLTIWQAGGLVGQKPEEAFFVRVDRTSMTQDDIDQGRTVILVGAAPLRPAEFVILRLAVERARSFRRSDPNLDGVVDLSDAVAVLAWLFLGGTVPGCLESADANADGVVDISDASYVLAWLFLGGSEPPPPFAACGPAPAGGLGCELPPASCP